MSMQMRLDTPYFNYIYEGRKLYETRVYDSKRQSIKLLDKVTFLDRGSKKKFTAKIVELSWFPNFREAIEEVGIKKVLPNARTIDDGVKTRKFPHDKGVIN